LAGSSVSVVSDHRTATIGSNPTPRQLWEKYPYIALFPECAPHPTRHSTHHLGGAWLDRPLPQRGGSSQAAKANATTRAVIVGIPRSGVSTLAAIAQRIWRLHGLQPHRVRQFKLSTDPPFAAKVRDIVGLYIDPRRTRSCSRSMRNRRFRRSIAANRACR
jgi:hypothetical protein